MVCHPIPTPTRCVVLWLFFCVVARTGHLQKGHYSTDQTQIISPFQVLIFILLVSVITFGVWLISVLGVLIGGPILILSIALIMGERRLWVLLLSSVLPVLVIYVLAIYVLKTPLP